MLNSISVDIRKCQVLCGILTKNDREEVTGGREPEKQFTTGTGGKLSRPTPQ